jgi:hypothetical protein
MSVALIVTSGITGNAVSNNWPKTSFNIARGIASGKAEKKAAFGQRP